MMPSFFDIRIRHSFDISISSFVIHVPMFDIKTLLILIPALPLAATVVTAVLGPRVLRERSHLPAVTAIALSFVASILLVFQVQEQIDQA